jgi:hypothetical protein
MRGSWSALNIDRRPNFGESLGLVFGFLIKTTIFQICHTEELRSERNFYSELRRIVQNLLLLKLCADDFIDELAFGVPPGERGHGGFHDEAHVLG